MGSGAPMGGAPEAGMGAEAGGAPEMGGAPGEEEMGAPAPEAAAGREKRESIDYSRKLGILLAASKKK